MSEGRQSSGHLFVISWQLTDAGGVNSVVKGLYDAFQRTGTTQPHILVTLWHPETLKPCAGYDVSAIRVRTPLLRRLMDPLVFLIMLPPALARIRRLIRTKNIRVINPHFPEVDTFNFLVASALFGVQLVVSVHGRDLLDMMNLRGVRRWLMRRVLSGADFVVVPSHALGRRLLSYAPDIESRIRVVWNGTNPAELRQMASSSNIELAAEPYVLFVGGFDVLDTDGERSEPSFRKGIDVLFHAWPQIAARNAAASLVVAGSLGHPENLAWIRDRAQHLPRVTLLLNQSDAAISRLMACASVLTLPSRGAESFGIVLIEAGAHGVPVVATTVDGLPEVVRDGVDGFLVPPEDPDRLAAAINALLADPNLARRMGENFRARVESQFTWTRAAQEYQNLPSAPRLETS